jgi:hypothetical protein
MDPEARDQVAIAVSALDQALAGLIGFAMTLRPTLRNEIFQICGPHLDRARQARDTLAALLEAEGPGPADGTSRTPGESS